MEPTPVALVGAGYIGDFHLTALSEDPQVRVLAVCDPDLDRARALAAAHGVPDCVADLAELPALGVRVIHLCTPPDLHAPLIRRALDAGLHVFCEKPLALCEADAQELKNQAQAKDLTLAVNHNNVFHPAFRRLVARIDAGEIGRVLHVHTQLAMPIAQLDAEQYSHWMFRAERNIIFEQGVHPISQVQHLMGKPLSMETHSLASRELLPGQNFHERFSIAVQAEKGTASMDFCFGSPTARWTLEVLGTDGFIEADLHRNLVSGERKTQALESWDSFLASSRRGGALFGNAVSGFWHWCLFTLKWGPRKDSFYVSMRDSIHAFHASFRAGRAYPSDAEAMLQVTSWCDGSAGDLPGTPPASDPFPQAGSARKGEVVITGASGFIGRRVVRRLLERGIPVTAVVRRLHSLPLELTQPARDGRLRLVRADMFDETGLTQAFNGARTVLHLATGGGDDWAAIQANMIEGARNVGRIARENGVQRFIYCSSVASLCNRPGMGIITDDEPTDVRIEEREIYSRGKAYAEHALNRDFSNEPCEFLIARPGVVMGPGTPMQHPGLGLWVRDNHCVGWGLGKDPIPFVHVEDVGEALTRMTIHESSELDGKALNLVANVSLSPEDAVQELARATGRDLHFHPRRFAISQVMEIGKWLVKKAGRRKNAPFPSWHDMLSRSLARPYTCNLARGVLGWTPIEDRATFVKQALGVYAPGFRGDVDLGSNGPTTPDAEPAIKASRVNS